MHCRKCVFVVTHANRRRVEAKGRLYQVLEQPSSRVQQEELGKQLRVARTWLREARSYRGRRNRS